MKKYSNDLPIIESLTGYGNEQSSGIFAFGLIGALLSVIAALVLWLNLGGLAVICDSQILMKVFHFHYTYGIIWLILTVVITVYLLKCSVPMDRMKVMMVRCGADTPEEMEKILQESTRLDSNRFVSKIGFIDFEKVRFTPFSEVLTIVPSNIKECHDGCTVIVYCVEMKLKMGDTDIIEFGSKADRDHDYEIIARAAHFEPDLNNIKNIDKRYP